MTFSNLGYFYSGLVIGACIGVLAICMVSINKKPQDDEKKVLGRE